MRLSSTSSGASNTGRMRANSGTASIALLSAGGQAEQGGGELAEGAVEGGEGGDVDRIGRRRRQSPKHADRAEDGQARGQHRLEGGQAARTGVVGALVGEGVRPAREGAQLGGGDAQLGDAAQHLDQQA